MKNKINFKNFYVKPRLPENLDPIVELSQNLWSTWDTDAYRLFLRIDPKLFREINHNPVKLLQNTSDERLLELSNDQGFLSEMQNVHRKFRSYIDHKTDFPELNSNLIAYFSMEYGLHESLPIYSGGLGVLSGDHLKAASDLGLPFVAFGLLYRYGYFSQKININGMQEEQYKENEWYSRPVQKVLDSNGEDLVVSIKLKGEKIYLKAWKIYVGKIPLYLLDSNLERNKKKFRSITDHLYVTDKEMRFLQEIVLAFGSLDLMKKIDLKP
ncbi:MAG: alpha-glucan family phosphorylase, partial [Candidatus Cloacimonetes bacterium]|nr:alpha-glucan family phosphorylase [Candidatus Cloacimonadota bacterium]